jgi:hypothetical protein
MRTKLTPLCIATFALNLLLATPVAYASLIVFSGTDSGGLTNPRPFSDAAAAAFDSAVLGLGTETIITFESTPVTEFRSIVLAPGVTLTGTNIIGGVQNVLNAPWFSPASEYGYNTTVGGSHFVHLLGGIVYFTFSTPINSFGAYITGVQHSGETITFNDGSTQTIAIPSSGGDVAFVGFIDAGKLISSVTISAAFADAGDSIGVDDVRYVSVPEPSTWKLLAASSFVLLSLKSRRVRVL